MDYKKGDNNSLFISLSNHFAALFSLIVVTVLFLGYLVWVNFDADFTIAFGIAFLIDFIPTIYLHIEYWLENKNERYEVKVNKLVRWKSGKKEIFEVDDIEIIKVFMSPALHKGSDFHLLGIEAYNFARIFLKSGEEIVITCLLSPKVEKPLQKLRGVEIRRIKRFFNKISNFS